MSEPLLVVSGLHTQIKLRRSTVHAVDGVDLTLSAGETLGLVGESGCGKSMTACSIMGLLPPGGSIVSGSIRFEGRELVGLAQELEDVRGNDIAMVFQDPLSSLNPTMTIGNQIVEGIRLHRSVSHHDARLRAIEVLDLVGIAGARNRLGDYPHQFSGGMRQRVMIAMALACEPKVLIADEPTTALDVTIQAQILDLIDRLRRDLGTAVILVTHDLGVIAGRADRVAVMYAGKVVETSDTDTLFIGRQHRYTEALLQALPETAVERRQRLISIPGLPPDLTNPPQGCRFAPRCRFAQDDCRVIDPDLVTVAPGHAHACLHPVGAGESLRTQPLAPEQPETAPLELLDVRGLTKDFPLGGSSFRRRRGAVSAVSEVSFSVPAGRTLGVVGESGCGKSTTGRLIVGLERPTAGTVTWRGQDTSTMRRHERAKLHRDISFMFQDPYSSLDPRMSVGSLLAEPLQIQRIGDRPQRAARVRELLDLVGLPESALRRFPHEFSGGQRQRIGLARAIALEPSLVVADEPVSALDVSIQAQVLNTMRDLQDRLGLSYVVISHDLAVIRYLADQVAVMYLGVLVELGSSQDVVGRPLHPYTQALVDAVPVADPVREHTRQTVTIRGELPSAVNPPSGCRFRTRCPLAQDICAEVRPPLRELREGQWAACHFPLGLVSSADGNLTAVG